jgi:hypothetical protein
MQLPNMIGTAVYASTYGAMFVIGQLLIFVVLSGVVYALFKTGLKWARRPDISMSDSGIIDSNLVGQPEENPTTDKIQH